MTIIGIIVALLLVGGGIFAFTRVRSKPAEQAQTEPKKKRKADSLNIIPVSERPFIEIIPQSSGRNVLISFNEVKKPADQVEYELEYQAGELLQGAFGELALSALPVTKDILFGSCSAGGACTYHRDVKGGSLLTRYTGPENYALKSEWKYFENTTRETEYSSKDAKFQIESKDLATQRHLVIFNSPGYPKSPTGTVISEVYSLTTSSPLKGKASIIIRASEAATTAVISAWNGRSWQEFPAKGDGKSFTAEVDLLPLYLVLKK